ncbi:MAG: four helix bundle suffix domain-containing protein [Moheibacter sp.]
MRTNKYEIWGINHRYTKRFRELDRIPNATYETYKKALEQEQIEICANSMICLINIMSYLLSQQIKTLEKEFLEEGELSERMTKARIEKRNQNKNKVKK